MEFSKVGMQAIQSTGGNYEYIDYQKIKEERRIKKELKKKRRLEQEKKKKEKELLGYKRFRVQKEESSEEEKFEIGNVVIDKSKFIEPD